MKAPSSSPLLLIVALLGSAAVSAFVVPQGGALFLLRAHQQQQQQQPCWTSSNLRMVSAPEAPPAGTPPAPKAKPVIKKRASKREIKVVNMQVMNEGFMGIVNVSNMQDKSSHRIVMGRPQVLELEAKVGRELEMETIFEQVILFMLDKGMKLENTEGMTDGCFPVNYFSAHQLTYEHPDFWEKLATMLSKVPPRQIGGSSS